MRYFDYDGQNDDQVRLPTVDDDRNNLRNGFDEVGGDAEANQQTTKGENTAEWLQTGTNDVEKKEDGDATSVRVFTDAASHLNKIVFTSERCGGKGIL